MIDLLFLFCFEAFSSQSTVFSLFLVGIFVASCAFDKTINLFDFFSGDLVAQVTGHSELITSVRFSPDGRYLLSVGGDGCIMIWSLAEPLVSAMQERLLELISSAIKRQKQSILNEEKAKPTKNSRSSSSSPDILSSPVPPTTVSSSSIMPPPPPSNIQMSQPQSQLRMKSSSSSSAAAAAASSSSLITDNIRSEIRKSIAGSVGASVASGRGNRWASRAEQQGGYELFGRKMSSIPNPEKHKLTLELTNFDEIDSRDEMNGDGKGKSEIGENIKISNSHSYDNEINDDSLNSNDNTDNNNENDNDYRNEKEIYHGNKLANTLEASDDVMAFEDSGSDDDHENDESSNLKKKVIQLTPDRNEKGTNENYDDYEDDFEKNDENNNSCNIDDHDDDNGNDIGTRNQNKGKNKNSTDYGSEAYLDKASKGIDILEQSAINLESWLENMVSSTRSDIFTHSHKQIHSTALLYRIITYYSVSFTFLCFCVIPLHFTLSFYFLFSISDS